MGQFFEYEMTVDSRDVDGWGRCRPSAVLGYLQEAATLAAEDGGFGREKTLEYHAFWMLARIWFRLDRPLRWEEPLTIRTWHREDKGATMYRDYDLFVDGEAVGECVSAWVLASMDTRQIIRLATVHELDGTGGGELCKNKKLSKLRLPRELELAGRRKLRYSDTDLNGHVNNTRYADFACDALEMERLGPDRFLSSMQIGYLAECRPGEELLLWTKEQDGTHFVQGMDEGGKSRFEAALIFGEVLP
mgnify:CR=1 FL=1